VPLLVPRENLDVIKEVADPELIEEIVGPVVVLCPGGDGKLGVGKGGIGALPELPDDLCRRREEFHVLVGYGKLIAPLEFPELVQLGRP